MKKFISIVLGIVITLSLATPISARKGVPSPVTIYMTVSDITDADNPFNVVADRIKLTVPYRDLASINTQADELLFNPNGLTQTGSLIENEKITCLHAIYELHKMVYDDNVVSKLYLDSHGDITLFFGKIVATMLYQNNDGVFEKPQNIEIADGDEINICLYNYGHSQQIAIFDELQVTVQRNEDVTLHLKEYLPPPEANIPIANAQLTDSEGVYITDNQGKVVKTDSNGEVTFNFSEGGLHRVSVMPEINYYLDTGEDETKETSKPNNSKGGVQTRNMRTVETVSTQETRTVSWDNSLHGFYNLLDETAYNYLDDPEMQAVLLNFYEQIGETPDPTTPVYVAEWEDEEDITDEPKSSLSRMVVNSTFNTRVVTFPIFDNDEPKPMVTYTRPFANIIVDDKPTLEAKLIMDKQLGYSDVTFTVKNTDTIEKDGVMPNVVIARFDKDNKLLGFVGDLRYNYKDENGNIYKVDKDKVTVTLPNCITGDEVTFIVYNVAVDEGEAQLDNDTVAFINQYSVTENGAVHFTFQSNRAEADYKVVVNKGGREVSSRVIHLNNSQTTANTSVPVKKTIATDTFNWGTWTTYECDVDDDPDNDTVYKVFCWDNFEPLLNSVTLNVEDALLVVHEQR